MTQKRKRRTQAEMNQLRGLEGYNPSRGLGDTIAKITKATGIEAVVNFIAGADCGCKERQAILNEIFPYRKPLCLTEKEYNYLHQFFNRERKIEVKPTEQLALLQISNRIFHQTDEPSNCASCVRLMHDNLKKVYEKYK